MTDQWEMCILSGNFCETIAPDKEEGLTFKEFIKSHPNQIVGTSDKAKVISTLLSEGWEPYGSREIEYLFRKKHPG